MQEAPRRQIIQADNLTYLRSVDEASVDLIYIDPPFNTGKRQERRRISVVRDDEGGDRVGFSGRRYRSVPSGVSGWADRFDDFHAFLEERLVEAHRVLAPNGSFFLHID